MIEPRGRSAVFLDRDGTLMDEVEYCRDPALVKLLPGVRKGLAQLKAAGFALVIVTNQSGIGRGFFTPEDYEAVHARLLELLGPDLIDAAYFCPDHPDRSTERRKPGIGMLLEAAKDLDLDLANSWMIGDKISDIECAARAGAQGVLVRTGYGREQKASEVNYIAEDFSDAVRQILAFGAPSAPVTALG
jgi:histidinol-phosphate phosphatase family protein